jgi:hypothetical protein
MTPKDEAPASYFTDLFERARRALAEHIGPEAVVLHPGSVDQGGHGEASHVAAQLRVDDRTREVIVRFFDIHTGGTIRELPPQLVAATAARLRLPTA